MSDMDEMDDGSGIVKKFMFLNRKAPHGTVYALEGLEVVLITAAFDQDVSMVFTDDGVYQLMKGIDSKGIEVKESFTEEYVQQGANAGDAALDLNIYVLPK